MAEKWTKTSLTLLLRDETIPLRIVEPLDRPFGHSDYSFCSMKH